jgi:Chitobiase/beta-hexosaminidase C-terminal domain
VGAPARINLGIDGARLIAPKDPWRSMILARIETLEPTKMPPLAHEVIDRRAVELLRSWIESLPGTPVAAPPAIEPKSGDYPGPVRIILRHADPRAVIRYTLDGTAPGKASPVYSRPFTVDRSTTVRARAYKAGSTRSIIAQETVIITR